MQRMIRLIKLHEVEAVYAYNSPFDERVINFNCDWFKCMNPLDDMPIYDIRGYVHKTIAFESDYQRFADENMLYTDAGMYSTSAENIYRYLINDANYLESHTALADCYDELRILTECIARNTEYNKNYKVYNSIKRQYTKNLIIKDMTLQCEIFNEDFKDIRVTKKSDGVKITVHRKDE